MKNGQKMFLIAQKKRSDALNATQKNPAFYKVWFLKKMKKILQNDHFWLFWLKMGTLWGFTWFFQKSYFVQTWNFLRCIQCIRTLILSYQKHILATFSDFSEVMVVIKVFYKIALPINLKTNKSTNRFCLMLNIDLP